MKPHPHFPSILPPALIGPGQVFMVYWWMQHFGGLTAKRHLGLSNAKTIGYFDLGKLSVQIRKKLAASSSKSAKISRSKSGRKVFSGSKFLKETGCAPEIFNFEIKNMICFCSFQYIMV